MDRENGRSENLGRFFEGEKIEKWRKAISKTIYLGKLFF
jgi:hypothetical protein